MYYEEEERFPNPDLLHVVRRELYAINSNLEVTPYGLKYVPTHTEDGIPIRKLYVSNLPPKTTRSELFGVFAPYGFIKSCWLRMGDKGPNRTPTPTYAFVTYSNPADAHKALQAPVHEKTLRGRNLRISPADSWHQPAEDADGRGRWKPRGQRRHEGTAAATVTGVPELENGDAAEATTSAEEVPMENTETQEEEKDSEMESCYTILDVLNRDCLTHILAYVPIRDLIRSERVSKTWQIMVREYLQGIRIFKTSWWQHVPVMLTTAVLRRVLQRVGAGLARLHIDHHWSALNDRTAHTVGKFCPNLEELKIVGMHTRNWNPLIYGCKQLKSLSFVSCNKLTDSSLVHLVKSESCIESLTVANNTHVTGLFLTGSNPQKLNSLAFYNCYSLQGTVLSAAIDTLPGLTSLKLDVCPHTMWKIIPLILSKLPKLEELSLSEYISGEIGFAPQSNDAFCDALATLTELKSLNLSRNIYITNAVLKRVAQSCTKLETLNISSCNSRKIYPNPEPQGLEEAGCKPRVSTGVGDEGLIAVCRGCRALADLDVSYLGALSDHGLRAAAALPRLTRLTARGNPALSAASLAACLAACPLLQVHALPASTCRTSARCPTTVCAKLQDELWWKTRFDFTLQQEYQTHKLLTVDVHDDRSNPHLRPDFVDHIFDDSSDDSLGDLYDHDDFDDFFGPDDELFLDDDLDDFDGLYQFGLRAPDIILL
uniref:RRM domain-containing protein n=1 Tax=Heliothis virescens TaxID=7102 RepID=A0A2A4JMK9_HELVI